MKQINHRFPACLEHLCGNLINLVLQVSLILFLISFFFSSSASSLEALLLGTCRSFRVVVELCVKVSIEMDFPAFKHFI